MLTGAVWNAGVLYVLKQLIDVISQPGLVFGLDPEEGYTGLLRGNRAAVIYTSAVHAVAGRAGRSATSTDDPAEVAVARVLTRSGRWVVLHGVPLAAASEPAHPSRIAPLLVSAYGLTEREQRLTRFVLQGSSTIDIADDLVISVHTVQGHLRNIFAKAGMRTRRDRQQDLLCPLRAAKMGRRLSRARRSSVGTRRAQWHSRGRP
jgi:DNA-binding CsgD family transcriptional regulator